jgi:hypothetical protein
MRPNNERPIIIDRGTHTGDRIAGALEARLS